MYIGSNRNIIKTFRNLYLFSQEEEEKESWIFLSSFFFTLLQIYTSLFRGERKQLSCVRRRATTIRSFYESRWNKTSITRIPTFYPYLPAFRSTKSPWKEKGNSFHERTDPRTYLLRILATIPDHIDTIPCHSVKLRIHLDFSVGDHPTINHPPITFQSRNNKHFKFSVFMVSKLANIIDAWIQQLISLRYFEISSVN